MENKFEFSEKQRFTQWWLWLLLSAVMIYTIYNFIEDRQYFSTLELAISIPIPILVIILFLVIRLETKLMNREFLYAFFRFKSYSDIIPGGILKKLMSENIRH
ncbi:hypothetical protein ACLB9Y_14690 [Chryseobacterium scophthalmum]|uniref:hypothetical protein n=1 Tax=Chryseobacterium scophthalmum TaxID=59733 RepID=UPI00398B4B6B